jgi:hypothetical protein
LWGRKLREEAEERERQRQAMICEEAAGTVVTLEHLDFRSRGGRRVTRLEEKRVLAQAVEIESRVGVHRKGHGWMQLGCT